MEMLPLVTILTPCYNGEEFLDIYFESILSQTYKNIELIFIDDGSQDRTAAIARSYSEKLKNRGIRFTYLYQENGGQAKAVNTGLKEVKGKYLVWPDSDDWLEPDSISKRVDFLEKNPQYDMVRSNGTFFDFDTKKVLRRISDNDNRFQDDVFLDLILEKTYCCCGCYMVKVSSLEEIYPDLTIYESSGGQNWQILVPMAGRYRCGYIDEDQYHIAVRKESHSRKERTYDELVERYASLKSILYHGIALSGRNDCNYYEIVDNKYERVLMNLNLTHKQFERAKQNYLNLKKGKDLGKEDKINYLYGKNQIFKFIYRIYFHTKNTIRRLVGNKVRLKT